MRSRTLRQDGSDAEARLWRRLRSRQLHGAKFRRQHRIGPYFADFCCVEARLIVELDGGQHGAEVDAPRTAWLEAQGYRLLRFWNHDAIGNVDGVVAVIGAALAG